MGLLDKEQPFRESCCDGGECNTGDMSAKTCGCDPGCKPRPYFCALHRVDAALATPQSKVGRDDANPPKPWPQTSPQVQEFIAKPGVMRQFEGGATRQDDSNKPDYEGFISPLVTKRFGAYMHKHRFQADGVIRPSDNWQKGITKEAYVKSLIRHIEDVRLHFDGFGDEAVEDFEDSICASMFNLQGLLFELLKDKKHK